MALITKTLNLICNQATTIIDVYDKFTENLLYSINNVSAIYGEPVYDATRGVLWVKDSSNNIKWYDITDTGASLVGTRAVSATIHYQGLTLNTLTGDLYGVYPTYVFKLTYLDAYTTFNIPMALASNQPNPSYTSITYMEGLDKLAIFHPVENTTTNYRLPVFTIVDTALTTYDYKLPLGDVFNHYYMYFSTLGYTTASAVQHSSAYNNISKNMLCVSDFHSHNTYSRNILLSLNTETDDLKVFTPETYLRTQAEIDAHTFPAKFAGQGNVFTGKNSGTIYYTIGNRCIVLDHNLNPINNYTFPIASNTYANITFDDINELYYMSSNVSPYTQFIIDRNGIVISSSDVVTTTDTWNYICNSTAETDVIDFVKPSVIVHPSKNLLITDTTPLVVFKVGENPLNWTQQFRVVVDTDYTKVIEGNGAIAYTGVYDSWLVGPSYADCTWEYSSDFDEFSPDTLNGTWLALGTGTSTRDGLGINGTDGLDSNTAQYFVRMTLPVALTGADTNTPWYFKVFSYSKAN